MKASCQKQEKISLVLRKKMLIVTNQENDIQSYPQKFPRVKNWSEKYYHEVLKRVTYLRTRLTEESERLMRYVSEDHRTNANS